MFTYMYLQTQKPHCISSDKCCISSYNQPFNPLFPNKGGVRSLICEVPRTKLAALYSATKSLQNSCTAKLQLFSSVLEAKQQLNSSCSGMQKRCAAFEALGSGFAAQLPTFKSCEVAAVTLQFSCARSDSKTFLT